MAKEISLIGSLLFVSFALAVEGFGFDCSGKQGCVTVPNNCVFPACDQAAHFEATEDGSVKVAVAAKEPTDSNGKSYVALGFSKDGQMGQDAVIVCFSEGNTQTMITPSGHNPPQKQEWKSGSPSGFKTSSADNNGVVKCSFQMSTKIDAGNGISFDLLKDNVNIFVVTGKVESGNMQQHMTHKLIGNLAAGALATSKSTHSDSDSKHSNHSTPTNSGVEASTKLSLFQIFIALSIMAL